MSHVINSAFGAPLFAVSLMVAVQLPADADNWRDPYARMQLSNQQRQQISGYQQQWNAQYSTLSSQLRRQQEKLRTLLLNAESDPLEITLTQQKINSLKEQLGNQATLNVLRKRSVLNQEQRQQLRQEMKGMLDNRTRGGQL